MSKVAELSKALLVRENKQKPKDPLFAPQPGQSLKNNVLEGCIAERKISCSPPSTPGFESQLCGYFFYLLLYLWTELRTNRSSAKEWISQTQLEMTSIAKYFKYFF